MDWLDKLIADELKPYNLILNALDDRKNDEGLILISQKHLGEFTNIHPTTVGKKLKVLSELGSVEQVAPGKYKLLHNDKEHTPHYYIRMLIDLNIAGLVSLGDFVTQREIFGLEKPMLHRIDEYVRLVMMKLKAELE
ncbi:hypothetical protein CHI12_09460 [Terribacillus saccharophilus]|uniref:Uncharacterized protein n=1 Tax=Terribacillus saccharophilus TaxID=361277 RepID=A0A268HD52_9BACI|nr:hypothetical protein [Terribacillus saccharophilus]PAE07784.1 hypothetical protein CHI12_09460 [Terribacillus saccharophilus]